MLTADRPAVGRSAQSGFTLRQPGARSSAPTGSATPGQALTETFGETEQTPGGPSPEPLGFPSERPRRRSGSLLDLTLGVLRGAGKVPLSTPVDNSVQNLWDAPPGAVDGRGNTM